MGAASPPDIIGFVRQMVGERAYPTSTSACEKAFKRDRENLRKRLGVEFSYSAITGTYTLIEAGPLLKLQLSDTSLRAIYLLSRSFDGHVGEHSNIQTFLDEIFSYLSADVKAKLEAPETGMALDLLQDIDPNHISRNIWVKIQKSVKGHRKLSFNYLSPTYEDGQKRLQQVVPIRIQYQSGHWYLRAYRLLSKRQNGEEDRQKVYRKYRLSYIQDDNDLTVSATVMPVPPDAEKYLVHYRLLPPLSRGIVSEHFDNMIVTKLDDGSLDITGYCDDVWEAGRLFLSYGEYCIVLGGTEVREWMEKTLKGMLLNYPEIHNG